MRVLMIEESVELNQPLLRALQSNGAVIDQIDSGEEALEMVRRYDYDIVLLDLMLSDIDGYEVVRRMRAGRINTPVLIMSSLVRPQARVKAFGMGADDFITKPYDLGEFVARVQAIIRRSKGHSQPTLKVGELQLSLDTRDVTVGGKPVRLTGKEYSILELLVIRKGMVLTKEVFLNHLYGGMDEPEVKIIDVFICKLRKKLAEAGAPSVIGTVWGRGYTVRDPVGHPALATGAPRPTAPNAIPAHSSILLRQVSQAA